MRLCGWCGGSGHNRRTCENRSDVLKKNDKAYYRKKRCSHCGSFEHTRPKCQQIDIDRNEWIRNNAEYRNVLLHDLKSNGVGVGAILGYTSGEKVRAYMIRSITWDMLVHNDHYTYPIVAVDIKSGNTTTYNLPAYYGSIGTDRESRKAWCHTKILSPVAEEFCTVGIPANWLSGESGVPENLVKKERKKKVID